MVHFWRYSSSGNTSLLIDELDDIEVWEEEKQAFATRQLDPYFGEGADEMIYIQKTDTEVIRRIDSSFPSYWKGETGEIKALMEKTNPHAILRFFDIDGPEMLMSGNGIRAAAAYLHDKKRAGKQFKFLTEIPTRHPRVKGVECQWGKSYTVDMGQAIDFPSGLLDERIRKKIPEDPKIWRVGPLPLNFEGRDLRLLCFIAYVGEPHLVLICGDQQPKQVETSDLEELVKNFFNEIGPDDPDIQTRSRFFQRVGEHFNNNSDGVFPKGINVNFVSVTGDDQISVRTFERGLNREVMASGTGAVASAFVVRRLKLVDSASIRILTNGSNISLVGRGKGRHRTQDVMVVHDVGDTLQLEGPSGYVSDGNIEVSEG